VATAVLVVILAWGLAGLMHWWPRLPPIWRLRISLATSAAGVGFLIAGVDAEGLREAATRSVLVVGPATLTATASASASLHYYVLTAVCLLLGFAGLVFGEPLSRFLAPRVVTSATLVAWLVTVIRFLLEKSAAPEVLTQAVGVTLMAPVAGALFAAARRSRGGGSLRDLVRPLWAYAYLVRGFVVLVGLVATHLHLGSHYDVSPFVRVPVALTGRTYLFESGSLAQVFWLVLLPQLAVWPLFTVATGLLGGSLVLRLAGTTRRRIPPDVPSEPLPSGGEG